MEWFNQEVRLLALNNYGPWKTRDEAKAIVSEALAEAKREAKMWKRPSKTWTAKQKAELVNEMMEGATA